MADGAGGVEGGDVGGGDVGGVELAPSFVFIVTMAWIMASSERVV
ncbi:hypothetical protein [Actinomadura sp. 21ATH]